MCKKYIGLLLFVVATMFVGCAEDPFDWSGDSARPVPILKELDVKLNNGILEASCQVEQHEDDLPILESGFFYGFNERITYNTGERIQSEVADGWMNGNRDGIENNYCYVGAYITTSRGTVTIGPKYVISDPKISEFSGRIENNSLIVSAYLMGGPVLEVGFFYGWEKDITYNTATHLKVVSEDGKNFRATIEFDKNHSGYDYIYAGAYFLTENGVTTTSTQQINR